MSAPPAKKLKGADGEAVAQEEGAEDVVVEQTQAMAVATLAEKYLRFCHWLCHSTG